MKKLGDGNACVRENLTDEDSRVGIPAFQSTDIRVFNFEQAVADALDPLDKGTIYTSTAAVGCLTTLSPTAVTLANNHVHDLGTEGVTATAQAVRAEGAAATGAGGSPEERRAPVALWPGVVLLSYCDYGRRYLRSAMIATTLTSAGVSPLRRETILKDLERLSPKERAVLYFHWGKEHVWLPPFVDVQLARELLRRPGVLHVIGMHAHRAQGELRYGDKRAYMGIGNLLFPNFMIEPPIPLSTLPSDQARLSTRVYHLVTALTLKKWMPQNRRSVVVQVDTEAGCAHHHWDWQLDNSAHVLPLDGLRNLKAEAGHRLLFLILALPDGAYRKLAGIENRVSWARWRMRVLTERARQVGTKDVVKRIMKRLSR